MSRRKTKDILSHLRLEELARVLNELLRRHPDLRDNACAIAKDLIDDVTVEDIAHEVADLVSSIDLEDLNGRTGERAWGYVEPGEAAWKLLEESIEEVRDDMQRRMQARMLPAAETICLGIILGLYSLRSNSNEGVLGWASDFLDETAANAVSTLVEFYPRNQRRAVGKRVLAVVEEQADGWIAMLQRVVDEAASSTRGRRK